MKNFSALCLRIVTVMALALSSCSSKESAQPSTASIASSIIESFDSNTMVDVTDRVESYYNFDVNVLEEYAVYVDGSGGFANEVAVLKVKDSTDLEAVNTAVDERIESQKRAFDGYNAKELKKIENNLVITKGNYILFTVVDDTVNAEKIFRDAF